MILYLSTIIGQGNVAIRTSDTDVLAISLGNIHKVKNGVNVFLEVGLASKNTSRFVDVTSLSKILGSSLCKALPEFHAFTGCDYSPSFAFKRKVRPLTLLEKNPSIQNAFVKLGSVEMLSNSIIDEIEKFVCQIYGAKGVKSVDECRFFSCMKVYKPKDKMLMSKVKGIDGSLMPSCKTVLLQQIKRANSICSIWNNATVRNTTAFAPHNNGWSLVDEKIFNLLV